MQIFNAAATGMGSIDWLAVPFLAGYFGATDMDMLIQRLMVIKFHKPIEPGA